MSTEWKVYIRWGGRIVFGKFGIDYEGGVGKEITFTHRFHYTRLVDRITRRMKLEDHDDEEEDLKISSILFRFPVIYEPVLSYWGTCPIVDDVGVRFMFDIVDRIKDVRYMELYVKIKVVRIPRSPQSSEEETNGESDGNSNTEDDSAEMDAEDISKSQLSPTEVSATYSSTIHVVPRSLESSDDESNRESDGDTEDNSDMEDVEGCLLQPTAVSTNRSSTMTGNLLDILVDGVEHINLCLSKKSPSAKEFQDVRERCDMMMAVIRSERPQLSRRVTHSSGCVKLSESLGSSPGKGVKTHAAADEMAGNTFSLRPENPPEPPNLDQAGNLDFTAELKDEGKLGLFRKRDRARWSPTK